MTDSTNPADPNLEAIAEEVQEERKGFDLIDRLVNRPKRKPEVVDLYMNEELGSRLGYVGDRINEFGIKVGRIREGLIGELEAEHAKAEAADESVIDRLETELREIAQQIRKDSLTVTLQWIPPIAEELLEKESLEAIGLKADARVPEEREEEYKKAWLARALVATIVSVKDNSSGAVKDRLSIAEADAIGRYLPKEQAARLDLALGKLLHRDAISREALDSADF